MMNNGLSASDVAVLSGSNRSNDAFGGEGGWLWIIVVFALLFGWGGNGFGGFGGGYQGGATPYATGAYTDAAIQRGFDNQAVVTKLDGITQGICNLGYDQLAQMNGIGQTVANGFHGVDNAICGLGNTMQQGFNSTNVALMQGQNALQAQLAQCCCDNRESISQVRYDMATQACDTRNTIQNTTRDVIDSQNAGTRAILEKLGQMEYNNLNDKYQAALSENQSLKFAASQSAQNAFITANNSAQTAELIRRLGADCPQPAYIVQPPTPVNFPVNNCGTFTGCGNGCGGCC